MIFDPYRDIFYAVSDVTNQIIAYDSNTWRERYRLDIGEDVGRTARRGLGAMAISDDSRRLFLVTSSGVRAIDNPIPDGVAASFAFSPHTSFVRAGVPLTVTITAVDASGAPISNYSGTVHWSSTDPIAELPADHTFTAADNGSKTFTTTLFTVDPSARLTATDLAPTPIQGISSTITVNPGAATSIPVAGVRDAVLDNARGLVYLTTSNGQVQRYDTATQSLLAPLPLGQSLFGADITPDGRYLYVNEGIRMLGAGRVYKVDLHTGLHTTLYYNIGPWENGGYDLAIMNNGLALLTTDFDGSGPTILRTLNRRFSRQPAACK